MVGKKKRSQRNRRLMGSHQKCWLWGRHAVLETLRADRWRPLEILCNPSGIEPAIRDEIQNLASAGGIPLFERNASELHQLCGSAEHQGLMAKMPPFPYADGEAVLERAGPQSAFLILCGIQDPYNFGSILRSADLFGIQAVIVPHTGQAAVSSHVARSSVGAVNYLDIVETDDLHDCCRLLISRNVQLLAATERGDRTPASADLTRGVALLIGNEGTGIPPDLLQLCEHQLRIPQQGHVGSLNAAVAAGILCYELRRQRDADGSGEA